MDCGQFSSGRTCGLALAFCLLLLSLPVSADATAAKHRYFERLSMLDLVIPGVDESRAVALPTLVRGIYELRSQQGSLIAYINEAATLEGDSKKFNVLPAQPGAKARPLGDSELASLRREVMASIDYERLITVRYGAGGGRRLVLFSAIDCGYCRKMEELLRKNAVTVNTTFYIIPMSIRDVDRDGSASWQKVSRIWCSGESGQAWRSYWQSGAIPPSASCDIDARSASQLAYQLRDILSAVGARMSGTPAIFREDGSKLTPSTNMSATELAETYGPAGLPHVDAVSPYWLADPGSAESASSTSTGGSALDLGGLLKKILK